MQYHIFLNFVSWGNKTAAGGNKNRIIVIKIYKKITVSQLGICGAIINHQTHKNNAIFCGSRKWSGIARHARQRSIICLNHKLQHNRTHKPQVGKLVKADRQVEVHKQGSGC